ncbi:MAG TPA: TlpA disulfide reductase family protein [Candidatus Binatia bacterium]|nr:TlpA disulfide reductase family protein [Candidatus Binatia bacterium]
MSSKLWVKLGLVMAIVGGIAALLAYGFSRDSRYIYSPLVAKPSPSFALTLFDGSTLNSKDLIGKAVLLNFWASWCVPCRAEARALEEAWRKYKDRNVVFVGVNIQDKEEDARAFMKEFGVTYLNGRDSSGKIAIDYGVWGIPETFFLDPQGRITYKHAGELKLPMILAKLDEALKSIASVEGKGEYRSVR